MAAAVACCERTCSQRYIATPPADAPAEPPAEAPDQVPTEPTPGRKPGSIGPFRSNASRSEIRRPKAWHPLVTRSSPELSYEDDGRGFATAARGVA
jgi:hypothetical protein